MHCVESRQQDQTKDQKKQTRERIAEAKGRVAWVDGFIILRADVRLFVRSLDEFELRNKIDPLVLCYTHARSPPGG